MEPDTTTIPDLAINMQQKIEIGLGQANGILQLGERAHTMYFAGSIIDDETGKALEYRDLIKINTYRDTWSKSLANEIRQLYQVIQDIVYTNTMFFVRKAEIPKIKWREITYGRIVVAYRLHKTKLHQ